MELGTPKHNLKERVRQLEKRVKELENKQELRYFESPPISIQDAIHAIMEHLNVSFDVRAARPQKVGISTDRLRMPD